VEDNLSLSLFFRCTINWKFDLFPVIDDKTFILELNVPTRVQIKTESAKIAKKNAKKKEEDY
jgi:hypothetical protein